MEELHKIVKNKYKDYVKKDSTLKRTPKNYKD
jgi:hypothetical protein